MTPAALTQRNSASRSCEDNDAWSKQMAWVEPIYSPQEVNKAAKGYVTLFDEETDVEKWSPDHWDRYLTAVRIINHWRTCHAYPLNAMQTNLRRMARKYDEVPVIAQRTKRLVSIGGKLIRNPNMKLTQMQDIGGCRAVLKSVAAAIELDGFIREESRMNHEFSACDNYIIQPKLSGYRGIHQVYRFHSYKKPWSSYNGLKIEIQLRSQLQHAWATTVETVGMFLGEALKASTGPQNWLRFFALMGSAIAMMEKQPLVPDTPSSQKQLVAEIDQYAYNLNVANRLRTYANAIHTLESQVQDAHYFLLQLDPNPKNPQLKVTGFSRTEGPSAQAAYEIAEMRVKENPGTDAVLVSVDSISSLSRAYPNYYADTSMFVRVLNEILAGA